MRKVDSVCERHLLTVAKAHAAGTQVGFQEALHNAELEYGAIASLPAPPAKSRKAYRKVMGHERTVVRRFHRIRPRVEWSLDPKKTIAKELRGLLMIEKDAGRSFKQLGLPHCVLSRPHA
jgi:hypothetical protein